MASIMRVVAISKVDVQHPDTDASTQARSETELQFSALQCPWSRQCGSPIAAPRAGVG